MSAPKLVLFLLFVSSTSALAASAQQSPSELVHPRIGTANQGQTFPSTGVPFAMTGWTPQTRDGELKCVAPYYAADTRIQGFRGSHFLSGSCTQDYGSFTLMPVSGPLKLTATERASRFTAESATPWLYQATLRDYSIHAEMTGTQRSGFMRFRYNRPGKSWLVLQTNSRPGATGDRNVHIDAARNEVSGQNSVTRIYAGSGKPAGFSGYFVMQFDHPIKTSGLWNPLAKNPHTASQTAAWLCFDLHPGDTLQVRIGTSFTSIEEARKNLQLEIPDWSFDRTANAAHAAWDEALGRITIAGSAPERAIFYTALYHSLLLPRIVSDADGSYPRFGGGETEHATNFTYYDDFSIWDTFRALHPLLTLLQPARTSDMVQSLIAKGTQGGYLPIYPAWNSYTSEMIGDHADAIIADAWFKGIRGFDPDTAYTLMRHNALDTPPQAEYADGKGRRGLASYLKYGYIPLEDPIPYAFHPNEQVSRTLEYAYDDFLVSRMAAALGKTDDAALFARRSANWKNVIDPETGFARGRHADGSWITPFNPGLPATYVTEGLPYQYTFFVPQDIPGLIDRLHGKQAFETKLDTLFARGYYDHGNEPSHHLAYLYNSINAPQKTQKHTREIMDTQYSDSPAGLAGNDDAGQMSAWYVMTAMGLYPLTPGVPNYEITTPRFDNITLNLPNGKKLHITAPGTEANARYITSVTLNGHPLTGHTITHTEILAGGELHYTLSPNPK